MSDGGRGRSGDPGLSVVIPAFRAERTIGRCLQSLAAQEDPPSFEVVVVDSSPDDETRVAVAAYARENGGPLDLRVERRETQTFPGAARNIGVARSRGRLLLFLDADCEAAADLVARAAAVEPEAGAVGGSIAMPDPCPWSARVRHLLEFKQCLPSVPARATWELPSACLVMGRVVFDRHGGFPATRASEDWLLNWRMREAGEPLRFDPRLRVRHDTHPGWAALVDYSRVLGEASGAARRSGGLPGQILVRHPWLAVGLPLGRTARALAWCARHSPRDFGFLLLAWPMYLAVASVWAAGFFRGVRSQSRNP